MPFWRRIDAHNILESVDAKEELQPPAARGDSDSKNNPLYRDDTDKRLRRWSEEHKM